MNIECETCLGFVEADEIGNFEYLRIGDKPSGRFVFLKCRKCNTPILVSQDNIGNMADGDIWDSPIRLFPSPEINVNPNAPKFIREAFEEAARCFKAKSFTAAAIMCRKTLEGICDHHGVKEGNLARSLEKMKTQALIDDRLYEWADTLRLAGNEAVHEVKVIVSKEDAKDMIDFSNAILDYLFSFRDKFEQFKMRRVPKAKP